MLESLKNSVNKILESNELTEKFKNSKTLEEVHKKCKESGYNGDYEEFKKDYEKIFSDLYNESYEDISEEELDLISGGGAMSKSLTRATAAMLSALTLSTSAAPSSSAAAYQQRQPNSFGQFVKNNKGKIIAGGGILGTLGTVATATLIYYALKDNKKNTSPAAPSTATNTEENNNINNNSNDQSLQKTPKQQTNVVIPPQIVDSNKNSDLKIFDKFNLDSNKIGPWIDSIDDGNKLIFNVQLEKTDDLEAVKQFGKHFGGLVVTVKDAINTKKEITLKDSFKSCNAYYDETKKCIKLVFSPKDEYTFEKNNTNFKASGDIQEEKLSTNDVYKGFSSKSAPEYILYNGVNGNEFAKKSDNSKLNSDATVKGKDETPIGETKEKKDETPVSETKKESTLIGLSCCDASEDKQAFIEELNKTNFPFLDENNKPLVLEFDNNNNKVYANGKVENFKFNNEQNEWEEKIYHFEDGDEERHFINKKNCISFVFDGKGIGINSPRAFVNDYDYFLGNATKEGFKEYCKTCDTICKTIGLGTYHNLLTGLYISPEENREEFSKKLNDSGIIVTGKKGRKLTLNFNKNNVGYHVYAIRKNSDEKINIKFDESKWEKHTFSSKGNSKKGELFINKNNGIVYEIDEGGLNNRNAVYVYAHSHFISPKYFIDICERNSPYYDSIDGNEDLSQIVNRVKDLAGIRQ